MLGKRGRTRRSTAAVRRTWVVCLWREQEGERFGTARQHTVIGDMGNDVSNVHSFPATGADTRRKGDAIGGHGFCVHSRGGVRTRP